MSIANSLVCIASQWRVVVLRLMGEGCLQPSETGYPDAASLLRRSDSSIDFFAYTTISHNTDLSTSTDTIDMTLLRAAIVFATQSTRISAAAKGRYRSSSFRTSASTLARLLINKEAVSDTIPSDSTSSKRRVRQKRELASFEWKRSTTRAIPSPIKTSERTSTRIHHGTSERRAGQDTTTPRMPLMITAVPMTLFHSILDNLACDDKWKRIGVMSSKGRVEEWLNTLNVAMSELD